MNRYIAPFLLLLVTLFTPTSSEAFSSCTSESEVKEVCQLAVPKLSPTQFSLGLKQVRTKIGKLEGKSEDKLDDYLRRHLIPVVIAPGGKFYLTDHHHLTRALWDADTAETNPAKNVYAEIQQNWSQVSQTQFWENMEGKGWVYLYDQNGNGPHSIADLPNNVRELRDDPYRSLSGEVRDEGGFDKTTTTFAELIWANFFRKYLTIGNGTDGWERALKEGYDLSQSKKAKGLPGYNGGLGL